MTGPPRLLVGPLRLGQRSRRIPREGEEGEGEEGPGQGDEKMIAGSWFDSGVRADFGLASIPVKIGMWRPEV